MQFAAAAQQASTLVFDIRTETTNCVGAPPANLFCAGQEGNTQRLNVEIDGKSTILNVDPGGFEEISCNPDFIRRTGISGRGPFPISRIGPIEIDGARAEVSLNINGVRRRAAVRWAARQATENADCIAGPRALHFDIVRFLLGPQRPDARRFALPYLTAHGGGYAELRVNNEKVAVRFQLTSDRTLLTASAARVLAPILRGSVTGQSSQELIAYGVARPIRRFTTRYPLNIGGLVIDDLHVRVSDWGDATTLRTVDPDELQEGDILVTAKRRRIGGNRLIRVGRTALARCVSLTFDRVRREIELLC